MDFTKALMLLRQGGTTDGMTWTDRDHVRIKMDTQVFVEVIAAMHTSEGVLLRCGVFNVSLGGFSATLKTEVPVGAILSVCVELPGTTEPFHMAAEVKWCKPSENAEAEWITGFKLLNSNDTDINAWHSVLEHV